MAEGRRELLGRLVFDALKSDMQYRAFDYEPDINAVKTDVARMSDAKVEEVLKRFAGSDVEPQEGSSIEPSSDEPKFIW